MTTTRRTMEIIVTKCLDCPFYERGLVNALADMFTKAPQETGTCKYNAGGMSWPFRRVQITDNTKVPSTCPMREGETRITIKSGA